MTPNNKERLTILRDPNAIIYHFGGTPSRSLNPQVRHLANRNHVYNVCLFLSGWRKIIALTLFFFVCYVESLFWLFRSPRHNWHAGLGAYFAGLKMSCKPMPPWRWSFAGVLYPVKRRLFNK